MWRSGRLRVTGAAGRDTRPIPDSLEKPPSCNLGAWRLCGNVADLGAPPMNDRPMVDAIRLSSHAPRNGGVCLPRSGIRRRLVVPAGYYGTPWWREIRQRYLASKLWRGSCLACGLEIGSPHVHHRSYRRAGAERLTDLAGLCGACHGWVHRLAGHGNLWDVTRRVIHHTSHRTRSPYNVGVDT